MMFRVNLELQQRTSQLTSDLLLQLLNIPADTE
jgi:hypothetical protein